MSIVVSDSRIYPKVCFIPSLDGSALKLHCCVQEALWPYLVVLTGKDEKMTEG